jgi:hypothetical protein
VGERQAAGFRKRVRVDLENISGHRWAQMKHRSLDAFWRCLKVCFYLSFICEILWREKLPAFTCGQNGVVISHE